MEVGASARHSFTSYLNYKGGISSHVTHCSKLNLAVKYRQFTIMADMSRQGLRLSVAVGGNDDPFHDYELRKYRILNQRTAFRFG